MRDLIGLILAVSISASIAAPAQTPAQAPEPAFRSTTSEVLLDLVVRDKHGRMIRDIAPGEIQVLEDGVPQSVRHFEFVKGQLEAPPPPAAAPEPATSNPKPAAISTAPPAAPGPTVNELRDLSVVSVVIGNLDPRGRKITLDALRQFAKTDLGPNTYVGVFTLGMAGLRDIQPYTNDAAKVSAAVEAAASNALAGQLIAVDSNAMGFGGLGAVNQPGTPTSSGPKSGLGAAISAMVATRWVSEMHDVYTGSIRTLAPLRSLVSAQAEIPGRKVVLLFSAGVLVHPDTVELLHSIISVANRANVSIYAMDTRGVTTYSTLDDSRRRLAAATSASMNMQLSTINGGDQTVTADQVVGPEVAVASIHSDTRASMIELAESTGGALLPDTLDLREPIREAIESSRNHYELTYAPANTALDGSFHKIEVKVSRPGARVFSRSGYYAVPIVNGQQLYPFEIATLKALRTKPDLHQFGFRATALQFRPGPGRTQMSFVFQTPARDLSIEKEQQWAKVHLCVTALMKDEKGQIVQKISKDIPYDVPASKLAEFQKGVVSFTAPFFVPAGHYTLETAAVDRHSMKASVSRSSFDVGQSLGFAMSDVSVARSVNPVQGPANALDPLEARGGKVTPELGTVLIQDESEKVMLYAAAYPPAPIDAPVEASIDIWTDNKLMMRSPASQVPVDPAGAASIIGSLAAAKFPCGEYEATVTFQYKGQKLAKTVDFVVTRKTEP